MALVWKLLTLIAVLAMPLGMTAAPAAAMQHHAVSMPMQHCPEQAPGHDSKGAFVECTMACSAALPATDWSSKQPEFGKPQLVRPAATRQLHGLHPETATPPPKLS